MSKLKLSLCKTRRTTSLYWPANFVYGGKCWFFSTSFLVSAASTCFKLITLSRGTPAGRNHMSKPCPGDFPSTWPCQPNHRSAHGKLALTSFMRKRAFWAACLPDVWIYLFFDKSKHGHSYRQQYRPTGCFKKQKNLTRQKPHYCSQVSLIQCVTPEVVSPQWFTRGVTQNVFTW